MRTVEDKSDVSEQQRCATPSLRPTLVVEPPLRCSPRSRQRLGARAHAASGRTGATRADGGPESSHAHRPAASPGTKLPSKLWLWSWRSKTRGHRPGTSKGPTRASVQDSDLKRVQEPRRDTASSDRTRVGSTTGVPKGALAAQHSEDSEVRRRPRRTRAVRPGRRGGAPWRGPMRGCRRW